MQNFEFYWHNRKMGPCYKREERNCPVQDSPSLSYTLKYKRILFYLLISETALVALVLTTEASDKTTKLKIIIIKPFLNF